MGDHCEVQAIVEDVGAIDWFMATPKRDEDGGISRDNLYLTPSGGVVEGLMRIGDVSFGIGHLGTKSYEDPALWPLCDETMVKPAVKGK